MDTTPQKLADWLQDKTIYLWDSGDEQYYASPICEDIVPMLRQQQAEIEALNEQLGRFMKHYNEMAQELERTKEAGKTLSEIVEPLLRAMGKLK